MLKGKKDTIEAKGFSIQIYTEDFKNDYISLTDIAKYRNSDDPRFVIQNWMRNRNTLEFIGLWEVLNNENFHRVQFDTFRNESGLNRLMKRKEYLENQTGASALSFWKTCNFKTPAHIKVLNENEFSSTWRK